jgi:hypothetical protein
LSKRDEGLLNTWAEKLAVTDIGKAVTSLVRATWGIHAPPPGHELTQGQFVRTGCACRLSSGYRGWESVLEQRVGQEKQPLDVIDFIAMPCRFIN